MKSPLYAISNTITDIPKDSIFYLHCHDEYEAQFLNTAGNIDNKISADLVRSSGLYDAFLRYKRFSKDFSLEKASPVLVATIVEILYLINNISQFGTAPRKGLS